MGLCGMNTRGLLDSMQSLASVLFNLGLEEPIAALGFYSHSWTALH